MSKDNDIFYLDLGDFLVGKAKRDWKVMVKNRNRVDEKNVDQDSEEA